MKFQKLKSSFEDVIFCWWREGLRLPTMTPARPIKSEFCAFYYLFKKKKWVFCALDTTFFIAFSLLRVFP